MVFMEQIDAHSHPANLE